jgi:hypothetical protein
LLLRCVVSFAGAIRAEAASHQARYEHNVKYLKSHGTSKRAAALLQRMAAKLDK